MPRVPKDKEKSKEKGKEKSKGKEKGKGNEKDQEIIYDYVDASAHDFALRADLMKGYEQFKARNTLTSCYWFLKNPNMRS